VTYLEALEQAVPLNEISIPGNPSNWQRWRWRSHGLKRADGQAVRLETWRRGTQVVTSPEAVERFFRELNAPATEARE
jgi:hypothetical protein